MMDESLSGRLGELSVAELERLSTRQQQLLRTARQQRLTKEERLKALMSQFHRHEQKLDSLRQTRNTLQAQEARLQELRQLRLQVDRQTQSRNQLSEELEKTRAVFAVREKELAEAVAKVDILTQQLDRTRSHKMFLRPVVKDAEKEVQENQGSSLSGITAEIDRLKQERRLRTQAVQQQKRKMEEKEANVLNKTLQRNQLDQRIHDIADRLHKRRLQNATTLPNGHIQPNGIPAERASNHGMENDRFIDQKRAISMNAPVSNLNVLPGEQLNKKSFPGDNTAASNRKSEHGKENRQQPPLIHSTINAEKITQAPTKQRVVFQKEDSQSVSDDSAISLSNVPSELQTPRTIGRQPFPSDSEPRQGGLKSSNLPNLVTDTLLNDRHTLDTSPSGSPRPAPLLSEESPSPDPSTSSPSSSLSEPLPKQISTSGTPPHQHRHQLKARELHGPPPPPPPLSLVEKGAGRNETIPATRRVKFDPQALLLDASLEGELELVVKTCKQVIDPSASNDEGITALHNAICAGHFPIVKFLVEFGCDVNAQDSDGWSPLHCAASCNNRPMCEFLVRHGACIFATTSSDAETAAEKCEEDEADFEGCSQYLLETMHSLGRINQGNVYAVYDYEAQNSDELSFRCGDKLRVLRTSDDQETEWYWSEKLSDPAGTSGQLGYIPRNLLALYPRVQRREPPGSASSEGV